MIENFILSLLIIALIFLVAFALRAIHKTWLAPSATYSLWWAVTTLVSIVVGYRETIPASGLLWILLSCIVIGIGSLVFLPKHAIIEQPDPIGQNSFPIEKIAILKRVYFIALSLGFLYIIMLLMFQKLSLSDLATVEGYLILAAKFSKERYEDTIVLPMYIKLLLPFVFFANCIGGMLFALLKKKAYLLCLVPPVIVSMLFTEKSAVLFCMSMWLASFITILVYNRQLIFFDASTIIKTFLVFIVIASVLFFSAFARIGDIDTSLMEDVTDKLYSSLFGHIAAFSNWFDNYSFDQETLSYGKFSFAGIVEFFGISKREQGLYTVNYQLANGELTNLYTIHKGLILDYSSSGALIVYFLFGMLGQLVFHTIYKRKSKLMGVLVAFYALIFVSLFFSVLIFNTTFLAICFNILLFLLL